MSAPTVHVLYLASAAGAAGAQGEWILETCRRLENGGSREFRGSIAIVRRRGECDEWSARASAAGIDYYGLKRYFPIDPTLWWRLGRLIRRLAIDIVHTFDWNSHGWALLLQPRCRFRMVANACEQPAESWRERLRNEIDHKLLPGFDRVIAANAQLARQLCQLGCRVGQVDVIPDDVADGPIPIASPRGDQREQLRIPRNAPVVGVYLDGSQPEVARRMLEAVRFAQGSLGSTYALMVGPDVTRFEHRWQLRDSGLGPRLNVFDVGDDLASLCRTVDVLVVAGDRSGSAVIEAQAANVPAVATPATGGDQLISHGKNGWIVADDSPAAVGTAIIQAIGQRRRDVVLRSVNRDLAQQRLRMDDVLEKLVCSYRKALMV